MAKDKETTIDDLARMVQKGFQGMDDKIQSIEGKMEKGFKEVNERIDDVEKGMDVIEKSVDALQRGQERAEDRLDEIVSNSKEQKRILKEHDRRITALEKKILLAN